MMPVLGLNMREEAAPAANQNSRKRKSPPISSEIPPQATLQHVLPSGQPFMHPLSSYQYSAPTDFTPGGLQPPQQQQTQPQQPQQPAAPAEQGSQPAPASPQTAAGGRALSNSKRAEQNRKAQRAFRERRDQHVKALEARSQLLDAALASADEANRRWEECRALVDQLRVENAALRAALSQHQGLIPSGIAAPLTNIDEVKKAEKEAGERDRES